MDDDSTARRAVADLREDYGRDRLTRADLTDAPEDLFERWLDEASAAGIGQVNAMSLATATPGAVPSSRMVLLRDFGPHGFVWFTSYASRKGRELAANPKAALLFWWERVERQVRLEGRVERVPAAVSDAYWAKRPLGSRVSAVASPQSMPVADRAELDEAAARVRAAHPGGDIPRPDDWGGFVLRHERVEFWQGGSDRLHDRFIYTRVADGSWRATRLGP